MTEAVPVMLLVVYLSLAQATTRFNLPITTTSCSVGCHELTIKIIFTYNSLIVFDCSQRFFNSRAMSVRLAMNLLNRSDNRR